MSYSLRSSLRRSVLPAAAVMTSLVLVTSCSSSENTDQQAEASAPQTSTSQIAQVSKAESTPREANGNLSEHGGARRTEGDQSQALQEAISQTGAKNVILLIGDGMGDSEITAARDYAEGAGGSFKGLDALPVTGQYTHYSLYKDGKPNYVTDSAASGSAWATGTKTYNGAISVDIEGKDQESLLERAKKAGLATGNVSTAELQDATPAVQAAHVTHRKCYSPDSTSEKCPDNALENGGRGSISEQILDTRADVTLGGGSESFEEKAKAGEYKDKTLLEQARERGYQLPTNAEELSKITEANQDKPVLGLFSEGNMPVRWEGPKAAKGGYKEEAATCTDNPERTAEVPLLADMTQKAIDLLKDKEEGFFLQVEGASIDKQDHKANPCGQIGETVDLDEAVQKALEFAKQDGETLVVVTADHAHTSQIVPTIVDEEDDVEGLYPGLTRKLITREGSELTMSYATNEDAEESQEHTGTQLRIAAYGPNSANVAGLTDQTDLFFTINDALGL
ncbi:alkaline phosphatase [Corynebacterium lowii]|uniref:Alkaline phosphatase n=1 Tax=Corynebacterium lowii TaxID=1544413 RepID=A0A0Q0UKQ1_9CORY|nr:alkaline phosphatase [Corynebacterium lowii]KQB86861.1 Alkaline phosphatase precursor [Corynebacterium lowii]MDP9851549.1 alkaline phosphatase [Corynebacterium lowii]